MDTTVVRSCALSYQPLQANNAIIVVNLPDRAKLANHHRAAVAAVTRRTVEHRSANAQCRWRRTFTALRVHDDSQGDQWWRAYDSVHERGRVRMRSRPRRTRALPRRLGLCRLSARRVPAVPDSQAVALVACLRCPFGRWLTAVFGGATPEWAWSRQQEPSPGWSGARDDRCLRLRRCGRTRRSRCG